jgi:hypothetical protein
MFFRYTYGSIKIFPANQCGKSMKTDEKQNLLYRRQFILASKEIPLLSAWKRINLMDKYILHVHPDLEFNEVKKQNKHLILLGEVYDPNDIHAGSLKIMDTLVENNTIGELADSTYTLAGRYAFIFIMNNKIFLLNDPSASRKVYYTINRDVNWCGSQPHLIADLCNIAPSVNQEVVDYYQSEEFLSKRQVNVINNTRYDIIRQLLPNQYLDLETGITTRFFPIRPLKRISLREGVKEASAVITNIMKSFHARHKLMMAVTAGNDTRILLAASRQVADDMYFYVNKSANMPWDHLDIRVAESLLKKMGYTLNIHEYPDDAEDDFKEVYLKNTAFPLKENLGLIYNIYYKRFQDRVNLPGNFSDISRNAMSTFEKVITPEVLAKIWKSSDRKYIIDQYRLWLEEITPSVQKNNYNILDLFNWEERNGNWYTTFQEDKDIAQEELIAFCSRQFMDICLGVHIRYRDMDTNGLYRAMVKHMWPDAASETMYPKSWKRYYLKKLHLYTFLRRFTREF